MCNNKRVEENERRFKMIKFYYNGIKTDDYEGLQKCSYSYSKSYGYNIEQGEGITIYKTEYGSFSPEIKKAFVVKNDSDSMTDYFETDKIRVSINHPLYAEVKTAWEKLEKRFENRRVKVTQ